jgi:uncharacterized protein
VTARLIVSMSGLSDDSPESLTAGADLAALLGERGVPLTHLVRPRGRAGGPVPDSRLVRWLHERRAAGDMIALHGFDTSRDILGSRRRGGGARGRAELATLPRHEAGLRLIAARRALTELSLRTDLFVPLHWVASAGTVEALREQGFRVLADAAGVRFLNGPSTGQPVRSRLLGFRASGELRAVAEDQPVAEAWRCRLLAAEVTRTVRRGGLVRINVRAKDLRRPRRRDAVLAAVDAAVDLGAEPGTYRLLGIARAA